MECSFFFRKILDDLASDGSVKMESYDESGSDASSPIQQVTDENTILNSGSLNKEQYQSLHLKNSVLSNSGVNISQVNKDYQSIQLLNNAAPTSSSNNVVQLSPQGLSENNVSSN